MSTSLSTIKYLHKYPQSNGKAENSATTGTLTSLPMAGHLPQQKVIPNVHQNLQHRHPKQALSFNTGAKRAATLKTWWCGVGPSITTSFRWFKAQLSSQEAPRSYQLCKEDGRLYCQNCSHPYKVPKDFQAMPDKDIVQSMVNVQTPYPARKPTKGTLQVPELSELQ